MGIEVKVLPAKRQSLTDATRSGEHQVHDVGHITCRFRTADGWQPVDATTNFVDEVNKTALVVTVVVVAGSSAPAQSRSCSRSGR